MNRHTAQLIALGAALALQACHDQPVPTESRARGILTASVTPADPAGRHLVVFTAERVPADFGERAARLGGAVETALDNIGVAAVTGLSEAAAAERSEEHTSELQSLAYLVCRLLLEKKKKMYEL